MGDGINDASALHAADVGISVNSAVLLIGIVTLILPFTPLAGLFGFVPLPMSFVLVLGAIAILYIAAVKGLKRTFYQRSHF
jgi:asparagine N-glycosylation enzyme membrane subunit Stt3